MAKPFRLYVCSDIHASERTWRKFLNAMRANVYKVDAAVIAGDLTGKAILAVVQGDHKGAEAWTATVLGQRLEMEQNPDVVRAHFKERMVSRLREWLALASERLEGSGIPVYLMPGNDDEFDIDPVLAESTYCQNVNEQVIELTPWHQLVSMGWSSPTPWSTPRELPEEEFLDRLSGLMAGVRDARRTVVMTHVPPYGSGLDTA